MARIKFEKAIARWRETRSRIVPTKGPIIEYGSKTTAKANAAPSVAPSVAAEASPSALVA